METRYLAGSHRSRGGGLVLALIVHAGLLALLVWGLVPALSPRPRRASLPVTFMILPPPRPPHVAAVRPRPAVGGRAPARASLPPPPASPPLPTSFRQDAPAPFATAEPVAADVALPEATVALGDAGRASGEGAGSGGSGTGTGSGSGAGDGGVAALARAVWIYRPTSDEIRSYWPPRALREHRSGEVLLACEVPEPGVPRRCLVIKESPRHLGFGAAAVRLSPLFRIKPVTRGGAVTSGWVLVPVGFDDLSPR